MNAKKLLKYLQKLEKQGNDLSKITLNYRYDSDSDVQEITFVDEDLFDEETNSILESIIFISDATEYI